MSERASSPPGIGNEYRQGRAELAVLDLAGTTVVDDGAVEEAFTSAIAELGISGDDPEFARMLAHVRDTMGQSKITVFRSLLGDEHRAGRANAAFERAYADRIAAGRCVPIPGAAEVIGELRAGGTKVALVTGFGPSTRDAVLDSLRWRDIADLTLTPAEAGRGRPFPDLVLAAVLRLGVTDVRGVAVAGDTPSDIRTGLRAGAGVVAGVLTGAGTRDQLATAGATHVLDSIRDLPSVLARHSDLTDEES